MERIATASCTIVCTVDVGGVTTYYRLQQSTAPAPDRPSVESPSGWTTTEPGYDGTSTNTLYTCPKTTLTDGSFSWGDVSVSSSYEAAKVAYNEAQAARRTATGFITELANGIWVTPSDAKPDAQGEATPATTGWHISDALEMLKSGVTAFRVWLESGMAKVRIGEAAKSHVEIDYRSMQMVDKDGDTYFHVGDLRGVDGTAEIVQYFQGDGVRTSFELDFVADSTDYDVYVQGGTEDDPQLFLATSDPLYEQMPAADVRTRTAGYFVLASAPFNGAVVIAVYTTSDKTARTLTFGSRAGELAPMSVVMGTDCEASAAHSFASGKGSVSRRDYATAMGYAVEASGVASHAEGSYTEANGLASHAEGSFTEANGDESHAEGTHSVANGFASHAEGSGTIAASRCQHVSGKYNVEDANGDYAVVVGNGTDDEHRSNASALDWSGNLLLAGGVHDLSGNALYAAIGHTHTAADVGAATANHTHDAATTSAAGFMSVADKAKLNAVGNRLDSDKSTANSHSNNAWNWVASFEVEAGTWLLVGHVQWAPNATGRRIACIATTNSGTPDAVDLRKGAVSANAVSGGSTYITTSTIVRVTSRTAYYLRAFQNSGGALDVYGCLQAVRVGT